MSNLFLVYPSLVLSLLLSLGVPGSLRRQENPEIALAPAISLPAPGTLAPSTLAPSTLVTGHKHHLRRAMSGLASWYGSKWKGRKTANGEVFDPSLMTASHHTLAFGSLVRVTNLVNGRSVVVRINDRGTLGPGRVIDLSSAAAAQLHMRRAGLARVRLDEVVPPPSTLARN